VKVVKAKSAKSLWCGRVHGHIRACEIALFFGATEARKEFRKCKPGTTSNQCLEQREKRN